MLPSTERRADRRAGNGSGGIFRDDRNPRPKSTYLVGEFSSESLADAADSLRWLEAAQQAGRLPDREDLLADPDLSSVRDEGWFQALLADSAASQPRAVVRICEVASGCGDCR
jgi:hypothetical protein